MKTDSKKMPQNHLFFFPYGFSFTVSYHNTDSAQISVDLLISDRAQPEVIQEQTERNSLQLYPHKNISKRQTIFPVFQ